MPLVSSLRIKCFSLFPALCFLLSFAAPALMAADKKPIEVQADWSKTVGISNTSPSLLFIGTPYTEPNAPLRKSILKTVKDLDLDYVRYVPDNVYPRLSIPELEPPTKTTTSWDFSRIDPMTEDAMRVLAGHPTILSFSTIPEWMFKTPKPIAIPDNPDEIFSNTLYEKGTELRDPTCHEVAEYFARIASWYADGGFTDELGKWHPSGHHYKIDYWEVLNEPDVEHAFTPQQYTKLYDAVVEAMRKVLPHTKFIGLTDSYPGGHPDLFEYFLNPKNHRPGIPLDAISYHFYAVPGSDEPSSVYPYTFFLQAERFIETVNYIETIRKRYSPHTETMIDEIGTMLPDDWNQAKPGYHMKPIDPTYWNLSGGVYAYVYARLAQIGIRVATASMLPAYPGNYPSIALIDWKTGKPNARLQVLKLIHDNFLPGDKLVKTQTSDGRVFAQAFLGKNGSKKVLLINERGSDFRVALPESRGGKIEFVDEESGSQLSSVSHLPNGNLRLGAFGVAVVTLP